MANTRSHSWKNRILFPLLQMVFYLKGEIPQGLVPPLEAPEGAPARLVGLKRRDYVCLSKCPHSRFCYFGGKC